MIILINLWANIAMYIAAFVIGIVWYIRKEGIGHQGGSLAIPFAVFNIVSNIVILILPIFMVWTLKMPRQKKLATSAVFAVGTLYVIPGNSTFEVCMMC